MNRIITIITLSLLSTLPISAESLDEYIQKGDSCMQQFNTFEALKCYQEAFRMADTYEVRSKLADCQYKRANYRESTQLLKAIPEDSLSHEAFRQLALNTLYSAGMSSTRVDSLEHAYKYLQLAFLISGMQHQGCAYRLGVVCVDTKRYPEGLNYLKLATDMMQPDTTIMKAITLSQGEGYYLSQHYPEAVEAWKRHLDYNPSSLATYFNIANVYAYVLKDNKQAEDYYRQFLDLARKEDNPTPQLTEMIQKSEELLQTITYRSSSKSKSKAR
jgi:tetratricopeptide (TPR) repeat protein